MKVALPCCSRGAAAEGTATLWAGPPRLCEGGTLGSANVKSSAEDERLGLPCGGKSDDNGEETDDEDEDESRSADSRKGGSFVELKSKPNLLAPLLLLLPLLLPLLPLELLPSRGVAHPSLPPKRGVAVKGSFWAWRGFR